MLIFASLSDYIVANVYSRRCCVDLACGSSTGSHYTTCKIALFGGVVAQFDGVC